MTNEEKQTGNGQTDPMADFCDRIAQMKAEVYDSKMEWIKNATVAFNTNSGSGAKVNYKYTTLEYILERIGPLWPKYKLEAVKTYKPVFDYGTSGNLRFAFTLEVEIRDLVTGTLTFPGGNMPGFGKEGTTSATTSAYKNWNRQFFNLPLADDEDEGTGEKTFEKRDVAVGAPKTLSQKPVAQNVVNAVKPVGTQGNPMPPRPVQPVRTVPTAVKTVPTAVRPDVRQASSAPPVTEPLVKPQYVPKNIIGNTIVGIREKWDQALESGAVSDDEYGKMMEDLHGLANDTMAGAFIETYGGRFD